MGLVNCPNCGRPDVSSMADTCPDCGYNIKKYYEENACVNTEPVSTEPVNTQVIKPTGQDIVFNATVEKKSVVDSRSKANGIKMKKKASMAIMIIGIILALVGIVYMLPATHLTTYESLSKSQGYSLIEEYINGDAYNYIIGASIVAGKYAGIMAMKGIFIAVGALIFCIGLLEYVKLMADNPVDEKTSPTMEYLKISAETDNKIISNESQDKFSSGTR